MAATYPLGIKRFTTKRDLLDDVDASHINEIQSEIEAVEDMLGPNPHQDNVAIDSGWKWTSLRARLEYMIRGYHIAFFSAFNGTTKNCSSDVRTQMTFAAPSARNDTHGLFSASQVKIKRAGYYAFVGRVYFNPSTLQGNRTLILRGSTGDKALAGQMITGTETQPDGIWVNLTWTGYVDKGETVGLFTTLTTGGYSNGSYSVKNAALHAHMIRDA